MHNEQVFTPSDIVGLMLSKIAYFSSNDDILDKHFMDCSAGDGHIILPAMWAYAECAKRNGWSLTEIKQGLETHFHAIEIDPDLMEKLILNVNYLFPAWHLELDFKVGDATELYKDYVGKMDYVVGNPPYCKIHDIAYSKRDEYKELARFNKDVKDKGTFDSYILFFKLGLDMLKDNQESVLCYITPNTWTTSLYGKEFRRALLRREYSLLQVIDMQHTQVFPGVTTFTTISVIGKGDRKKEKKTEIFKTHYDMPLSLSGFLGKDFLQAYTIGKNDSFFFQSKKELETLNNINKTTYSYFTVKNGFATLNDKLFVSDEQQTGPHWRPCRKISKDKLQYIFFPYDVDGKPLGLQDFTDDECNWLFSKSKELYMDTSSKPNTWFLYGRTQAIKDANRKFVAVNNLFKTKDDVKLEFCDKKTVTYSAFYILSKGEYENPNEYEFIKETLKSDDFIKYVSLLARYKNGGYYTITSDEMEKYINFKWQTKEEEQ